MSKRLYKSEESRVICGVCGGIGEYVGIDPTIIRLLWIVLGFFAGIWVGAIILYIVAAAIIPRQPVD